MADRRVGWLHGVRALAAGFVVLHHVWLGTYSGFPGNNGPIWTAPLVYGHLAVAVFIVVSGYSLTLSPARHGLELPGGGWGFIRRRFWRIVPAYWVSLALSSAVVWLGVIGTPTAAPLAGGDVAVHALLFQDTVGSTPPNGVFWSIAVEWHIYFFFPLLLLAARWAGLWRTVALAAAAVIGLHVLAGVVPVLTVFDRFTPQFFLLFVLGLAAAATSVVGSRAVSYASLGGVAAVVIGLGLLGSRTAVAQFFWVDVAVGAATALCFVALARGGLAPVRRVLGSRVLVAVGEFAFSIYLVHGPILEVVRVHVLPDDWSAGHRFALLLVVGVPLSLLGAWLFFLAFERPFLTIRSWPQFRETVRRALVRPSSPGLRADWIGRSSISGNGLRPAAIEAGERESL